MKAWIKHIGVLDREDNVHAVTLHAGVNVITGKSSTGKSALIEIFDYCFGSSDFTVPVGVITQHAELYFTVLEVKETILVLARSPSRQGAFIKEEPNVALKDQPNATQRDTARLNPFRRAYFENAYFRPLDDFKRELGHYFGLNFSDVDENLEVRNQRRNKSKSPTPTVRSFVSFMLQHQNLIANKHAVFYRFDEKEKRDQAIEHLKIFLGFVDQTYFLQTQNLNSLLGEQNRIQVQIPRQEELLNQAREELEIILREYSAITGTAIEARSRFEEVEEVKYSIGPENAIEQSPPGRRSFYESASRFLQNPQRALETIRNQTITLLSDSEEYGLERRDLEAQRSQALAALRKSQRSLAAIRSSIEFARDYVEHVQDVTVPDGAELHASLCPFCHSHHPAVERQANLLVQAIDWLNEELASSSYLGETFETEEREVLRQLREQQQQIKRLDESIQALDNQVEGLEALKSQYELSINVKTRIEVLLEQLVERPDEGLKQRLEELGQEIQRVRQGLQSYNVEAKLRQGENYINSAMAEIGQRFEFEESYRPINLHFSLSTFDLWHQSDAGRVFLRSMGSGANWLYCHLTLFLALHKYFSSLGERCSIPSILFLDQPSQVYFPSTLDTAPEFDPESLAKLEGPSRQRQVDEDIQAVANLYSQLVRFCEETTEETGITPQIIVTDHADNLILENGMAFGNLVRERWRTHGFINPL